MLCVLGNLCVLSMLWMLSMQWCACRTGLDASWQTLREEAVLGNLVVFIDSWSWSPRVAIIRVSAAALNSC